MSVEVRAKTRSKPNTVHYAAETGNIKLLEHFVREGMAVGNPESVTLQSREDVLGMMPLHVACENGELEVVEFLVRKRVDMDAGDNFKVTALHLASIEDQVEIVEVLLKARADPKPVDVEGDLPIHWAATKGHSQVIELLAKKGSPIDVPNKKGWAPLHRAAYNGRKDAAAVLVKLGAHINGATVDGNTPLHLACFMNQLGTVEKLCEMGASQRLLNKNKQRPIDMCITDAAKDILKSLQGFDGDEPAGHAQVVQAKPKDAPAATGKPMPPNLTALQINNKKEVHDGFPSPNGAVLASRRERADDDSGFMQTALGGDGGSPFSGMSSGPAGGGQGRAQGRTAASGANASAFTALSLSDLARPASQGGVAGPGPSGGLAAHPTPLAGSLRPLRTPSPVGSSASMSIAVMGSLRPPSTGRGGIDGSTGELSQLGASRNGGLSPQLLGEDVQERIKEENRRLAASNEVLRPRSARPVSANKKFLARYNLDKLNLFAP